jgi:hypothetical protein|tara:strand:- start:43 stop:222 length:180 start_codon:yes stop_codon:yes gene_type:complete
MKIEKLQKALKLAKENNTSNFKKFYNPLQDLDKKLLKELGTRHEELGESLVKIKAYEKI